MPAPTSAGSGHHTPGPKRKASFTLKDRNSPEQNIWRLLRPIAASAPATRPRIQTATR